MIAQSMDQYREGITKELDIEVIKLLVQYGANINSKNKQGKTPLECAINSKHIKAEKYLRSLGAKTAKRN